MKQTAALVMAVVFASTACNGLLGIENREEANTHSAGGGGTAGSDGTSGARPEAGSLPGGTGGAGSSGSASSAGSSGSSSSAGSSGSSSSAGSSGSSSSAAGRESSVAGSGGAMGGSPELDLGGGSSGAAKCGNGATEAPEQCDDGNKRSWDGCDATCVTERGWSLMVNGTLSPEFDPARTEYTLKLPLFVDTLELTARASGAKFKIGATDVNAPGETFFIGSGTTKVELDLIADGRVQRTFGLTVRSGAAVQDLNASSALARNSFGNDVALSADGNRLVVGAPYDEPTLGSPTGAVYIFERSSGGSWLEKTKIVAPGAKPGAAFGTKVAISADGATIAVSAPGVAEDAGAVSVFTLATSGKWDQKASLQVSAGLSIGGGLSLSGNGAVLAVGAYGPRPEGSYWASSESVCVFRHQSSDAWAADGCVKASNADVADQFGAQVRLSEDGTTLVVSAPGEGSISAVAPQDNSESGAGAAYVFTKSQQSWSERAFLKASDAAHPDSFGTGLALSGDAQTIAVGAYYRHDGPDKPGAGAVYVFGRSANETWREQKLVQPPFTELDDYFGYSVALNRDGTSLAVGSLNSAAIGQPPAAGAVQVFFRDHGDWLRHGFLKSPHPQGYSTYGRALAWSADGQVLAIGAFGESGNSGAPPESGAVYMVH